MNSRVFWAHYLRPIPKEHPMWHFQRENEWIKCKWATKKISCQEWTIKSGWSEHENSLPELNVGSIEGYLETLKSRGFILFQNGSYPLGKIDFNKLKEDIKRDARASYEMFRTNSKDQHLSGFAMVSDSCAMTLGCLANTKQAIENREKYLSKNEAEIVISEWPLEDNDKSRFSFMDIINYKNEHKVSFDPQIPFNSFRRKFYESCICALEELRQESFFPDQDNQDFFILFFKSFDEPGKGMSTRLNPKRLARCIKRVTSSGNFIVRLWCKYRVAQGFHER